MRPKRFAGAALGVGLLLLGGCGDGGFTPFDDFFGGGTTPGSSFDTAVLGRVEGVIYRRTDSRIVVLGAADAPPTGATPVVGATVEIVELGRRRVTGADGAYAFDEVPPAATYNLRITLPAALGGLRDEFKIRVDPGGTTSGLPTGD